MNFLRRCCKKSLKGLRISKKNKKHVIDKHFHRTDADYISFFYPHISLRMVFERFRAKLRAGILKGKPVYPSKRLIYCCPLDFEVGTFPLRSRRWGIKHHKTCYVRVVCATSQCSNCGRLVPSEIITIFPDRRRN